MAIGIGIIIAILALIYFTKLNTKTEPSELTKAEYRAKGTIFYHEDDFCQIEIVPKENVSDLLKQADNIADFKAEKGYWDIYVREENKVSLKSRKIEKTELEKILTELGTKKHTEVITGYGSNYRVKSENTIGYGKKYSAVYFDFENDKVQNIWITNIFGINHDKVVDVLSNIGKKWNLVMMDWNRSELIDLTNKEMINKYLNN
jgi:methyltransferase-like protein